jgi:hypothetical protein
MQRRPDEEAAVAHLFLQPQHISIAADGTRWIPSIYGTERTDGLWEAWIEFRAMDERPVRVTDRETTQPNRQAVEYWSTGLEPIYFEGAFSRAVALPA